MDIIAIERNAFNQMIQRFEDFSKQVKSFCG
ncbi:hypothetical protein EZS27_038771, partial [termite gut metagenome]